ncbi:VanZ family protein [candidate division WOR-3 bacterium]|nr:VanZ family protein [candidate division WOR-3 bacterium]
MKEKVKDKSFGFMSLPFGLISVIYIALIFILSGIPSQIELISKFNPLSLLHIPLYGLLTFFLIRTFWRKGKKSLILAIFIALLVAVFDELNQIHIPGRMASGWDVVMDAVGIGGMAMFYQRLVKYRK